MKPPTRTELQREESLKLANQIRIDRANLKKAIRRGDVSITDTILRPPECAESAKVIDILKAMRGVGEVKAAVLLDFAGASPRKTMAGLSERQRHALCDRIEQHDGEATCTCGHHKNPRAYQCAECVLRERESKYERIIYLRNKGYQCPSIARDVHLSVRWVEAVIQKHDQAQQREAVAA